MLYYSDGNGIIIFARAPVAQLDRALDSGSRCRGFESSRARHLILYG